MVKDGPTYYALLQVDPAAEPEVIESAYRRLARKYHPDVNASPDAHARMRAINEAYRVLSDPARRAAYDRLLGRAGLAPGHGRGGRVPTERVGGKSAADQVSLTWYRNEIESLRREASQALTRWAGEWSAALDAVLGGDARGRQRGREAGQSCLDALNHCLARWEALTPPAVAARLSELGAALLKLELALVRGGLAVLDSTDYALLEPLAGLARRIGDLARTTAAEVVALEQAGS